jgi:hypothetical protein
MRSPGRLLPQCVEINTPASRLLAAGERRGVDFRICVVPRPHWVNSGHTDMAPCPLYPQERTLGRIQVSIWLSVYEYTP